MRKAALILAVLLAAAMTTNADAARKKKAAPKPADPVAAHVAKERAEMKKMQARQGAMMRQGRGGPGAQATRPGAKKAGKKGGKKARKGKGKKKAA